MELLNRPTQNLLGRLAVKGPVDRSDPVLTKTIRHGWVRGGPATIYTGVGLFKGQRFNQLRHAIGPAIKEKSNLTFMINISASRGYIQ
jgi:hypothetical protein